MRARLACIAGLSAVALLAAACGQRRGGGGSTPSSGSGGSSSSAPAAAFKACMVTDTGRSTTSRSTSRLAGATAGGHGQRRHITVKYLPSTSPTDYAPNITAFISQKCGIIVTVGFLMGERDPEGGQANPNQKFAIVDFSYDAAGWTT